MSPSGKMVARRGVAKRSSAVITPGVQDSGGNSDAEQAGDRSKAGPSRESKQESREGGNDTGMSVGRGIAESGRKRSSPIKTYSVKKKRRAAAAKADEDSSNDEIIPSSNTRVASASSPVKRKPSRIAGKKEKRPLSKSCVAPALEVNDPDNDDSDLTPLSSPAELHGKLKERGPVSRRQNLLTREHPMFITTDPTGESLSPRVQPKPSWEAKEAEWDFEGLGKIVWVHLDGKNSKTANVRNTSSKGKESVWWPAAVLREMKVPLTVKLFGNYPRTILIDNPSSDNVRSRLNNFSLTFDSYEAAFQGAGNRKGSDLSSPRKRLKAEDKCKTAWETATNQMIEMAQEASIAADELPHPMEALSVMTTLRRTGSLGALKFGQQTKGSGVSRKGKRKRSEELDTTNEEPSHEPPSEDADLEVPNELVLSRTSKPHEKVYWPAKLMKYVPPKRKGQKGTYKVTFLDMTQDKVPRTHFFTSFEAGFGTCKLGNFESATVDDTNDCDEVDIPENLHRSPSPVCRNPAPSQSKYITLSLREQFVYVKPVLQAILHDQYEPAREKVQVFMSGAKRQQANLSQLSSDRGMMLPRQVEELAEYLKRWCLRDENTELNLEDDIGIASDAPTFVDHSELSDPPARLSPAPTESNVTSSPPPEPPSSSFSPLTDLCSTQGGSLTNVEQLEKVLLVSEITETGAIVERFPRQTGSAAYEALSYLEKLDFCTNILLQEAIRQILLWRAGTRTSVQLLSAEEERELFEEGHQLLQERDWVDDIMRLRTRGENKEDKGSNLEGRRRKKPVNYAE